MLPDAIQLSAVSYQRSAWGTEVERRSIPTGVLCRPQTGNGKRRAESSLPGTVGAMPTVNHRAHSFGQLRGAEGLREQTAAAIQHVSLHDVRVIVAGNVEHLEIRLARRETLREQRAAHARRDYIRHQQINLRAQVFVDGERVLASVGRMDFVAEVADNCRDQLANLRLIIDHK